MSRTALFWHKPVKIKNQKKNLKKSTGAKILIFPLILLFLSILFFIGAGVNPPIREAAKAYAANEATRLIHRAVNEKFTENGVKYENMVNFLKNSDGEIAAVTTDTAAINKLKAELAVTVADTMDGLGKIPVQIPAGALLGSDFWSGFGPRIPLCMTGNGYVTVEVKNAFSEAGINQTLHRIWLEISAGVNVVMPGARTNTLVTTEIPVAETVLVGKVPGVYAGVLGK